MKAYSFLRPFQSSTFLAEYLLTVQQITENDTRTRLKFAINPFVGFLFAFHLSYLYLVNLSHRERILHSDVSTLLAHKNINLAAICIAVSMGYYLRAMYWTCSKANNSLLASIVLQGSTRFFLYPKTDKGGNVSEAINDKMRLAFNLSQGAVAAFEITSIGSQVYLLIKFITLVPFDSPMFLLHLSLFWCYSTNFYYILIYCSALCSLILTIGMTQLDIFLLKLRQLRVYLLNIQGTFQERHYAFYLMHLCQIMVQFAEYNRQYGRIFLVFLVVNVPINVYIVILLLDSGHLPILGRVFLTVYGTIGLVGCFLIHLYLAGYTKCFHSLSNLLLKMNGKPTVGKRAPVPNSFRTRLSVSHTIAAFHTTRRYGVTYGHFGLVTLRSFTMFLLLYGKFLMTVYRRRKDIQ